MQRDREKLPEFDAVPRQDEVARGLVACLCGRVALRRWAARWQNSKSIISELQWILPHWYGGTSDERQPSIYELWAEFRSLDD
jgi:hypothetical protein